MSIKFAAAGNGEYFDIVTETETVTKQFLDQLMLRFFTSRESALGWLTGSTSAAGRTA